MMPAARTAPFGLPTRVPRKSTPERRGWEIRPRDAAANSTCTASRPEHLAVSAGGGKQRGDVDRNGPRAPEECLTRGRRRAIRAG
jgi:hypothetical protein